MPTSTTVFLTVVNTVLSFLQGEDRFAIPDKSAIPSEGNIKSRWVHFQRCCSSEVGSEDVKGGGSEYPSGWAPLGLANLGPGNASFNNGGVIRKLDWSLPTLDIGKPSVEGCCRWWIGIGLRQGPYAFKLEHGRRCDGAIEVSGALPASYTAVKQPQLQVHGPPLRWDGLSSGINMHSMPQLFS